MMMEDYLAPSSIPKLLVAPSCLPRLSKTIAAITDLKAQLSQKKAKLVELQLQETDSIYLGTYWECHNHLNRGRNEQWKVQPLKSQMQILEAMAKEEEQKKNGSDMESIDQLRSECDVLESEISGLENEANAMRMELAQRIYYLVVSSVNEMKIVNELRLGVGVGATPGMPCFRGKVYVPDEIPKEVATAIAAVERSCETL